MGYGKITAKQQQILDFIKEAKLSNAGFFAYSREEGTPAYKLDGQIENKVKNAVIIDPNKINTSKVNVGCTVEVLNVKLNRKMSYKIVGDTESDPVNGIISNISPVGAGLMGKKVGEVASIKTPGGLVELKVVKITA